VARHGKGHFSGKKVDERAKLGIRSGDTVRVAQKIFEYKKGKGADKKEKTIKTPARRTSKASSSR
jgi:hypothetical protein